MKFCTKCGAQVPDDALVCPSCGMQFAVGSTAQTSDTYDHTAEFSQKDISDNKVVAMLPYLLGIVGLIIAALMSNNSKYIDFHVRTSLKFTVVSALLGIASALLCWTIIVPAAGVICLGIVAVLRIIAFFQVCGGKAKDPAIIRDLGFLK